MIGKVLAARYEVTEKIGEGGMAEVYKAKDLLLGRSVAVKVLRPQFALDEEFVERFKREAQSAASLSHPNVVNIYDVGRTEDAHFIVMEFIEGENLKALLKAAGRLPVSQAAHIGSEVLKALSHAHKHGVVHRDIKPHNILRTTDGRIKVADFGIARTASTATLTHTGTVLGSIHYLSPEQAKGEEAGVPSDLYSVGVLLYEMLSGKVPFPGNSPIAVALKHVQEKAAWPAELSRTVPRELEKIVLKALDKDPGDRYQSADEMLLELRAAARSLPEERAADGPPGRSGEDEEMTAVLRVGERRAGGDGHERDGASSAPTLVNPEELQVEPGRPRSRRRLVGGFVAAALLAALVFTGMNLDRYVFPPEVAVPSIMGRSEENARALLERRGLQLEVDRKVYHQRFGPGIIVSQDPGPDRMVKKGRTVWAVLSLGPEVRSVPAVEGLPLREAKLGVTQEGFTLGEVTSEFSSLVPANYVIRQAPAGGTKTEAGRAVNLVVSKGEEPATTVLLPDFKGQSLEDVKARLEEMGLRLGNVWQEFSATLPPGTVVDQNPPPTTEVERGWLIDVVVSRGQASPDTGGGQSGDEDPAKPVLDSDEEGRPGTLGAGSGSSRLRTPPPSSRWHEAEVTVNVPPGQDQEVVIVVLDDFGSREVFREMKPGGSVLVQSVEGRGLDPKIRVFLGGSLIKEVSFPR